MCKLLCWPLFVDDSRILFFAFSLEILSRSINFNLYVRIGTCKACVVNVCCVVFCVVVS